VAFVVGKVNRAIIGAPIAGRMRRPGRRSFGRRRQATVASVLAAAGTAITPPRQFGAAKKNRLHGGGSKKRLVRQ